MTKTIAQLWNGKLEPIRHLGKNNSEMKQLGDLMQRNLKKFEEILNEHQRELFEKSDTCISDYIVAISEQAFCDGFCMGTRIITEALTGAEQIK